MDPSFFKELLGLASETSWVEFKHNNDSPDLIGEYISALSNSAKISDQPFGYLIFGVEDTTHKCIGTKFSPRSTKKGAEEFIPWFTNLLEPRIHVEILEFIFEGVDVVVFKIPAAAAKPLSFKGNTWIRVHSSKNYLSKYPDYEKILWAKLQTTPFELQPAKCSLTHNDIFSLLDIKTYFKSQGIPYPSIESEIIEILIEDNIITKTSSGFDITNLGAILFAFDMNNFPHLANKTPRVIQYNGINNLSSVRDSQGKKGYALSFVQILDSIIPSIVPIDEDINTGLRKSKLPYPEVSLREFFANSLIHQDFAIGGSGPRIEVYNDRIEISNPGSPLINVNRFLDHPPCSRNEKISSVMYRLRMCERRGSGIDRAVSAVEEHRLPAPKFEAHEDFTRVTLYFSKPFTALTTEEKLRACYLHASVQYIVNRTQMTNSSLRQRLGITDRNYSQVSRLLGDALKKGIIKEYDPGNKSPKHTKYVPFWA